MKKYAIISLGGKQFKIVEGLEFKIERQSKLDIGVLLFADDQTVEIGEPLVKDVTVKAKILRDERAPKIRVARFKSKSRYRKVKGHRQPMSVIKIESITKGAVKAKTEIKKSPAKKAAPKKVTKKKLPVKKAATKTVKKGSK